MDRIDLFRIFARVVEGGSFTRAADSLRLPRSTVSTAVQDLEARLGVRLLHRTTRRVTPTADGTAFYERALRLVQDMEEAEGLFRQSAAQPRGLLRVNVPGRIGRRMIAPALPDFLDRYPAIDVDLGVTDRPIDLVGEGVDAVIRVGHLPDSGLIARTLGTLPLINCASPAYLARHGVPMAPGDLAAHVAVNYASPLSGRIAEWECGAAGTVTLPARVTVNSAEAYIACCLAGLGLIQIPAFDVQDHLGLGELVEVMPDWRAAPMPIAILYPHRHQLTPRLRVFVAWIEALFRARLAVQ
ncbi:LysR family transcriptional regulator [Zavarzinia compransoris]|uniref:LysR family transcriptional regulator n=1 Tax=Zavarzinia compransoris TaxID=1264899 RepID=A0A317DXY0_9PROT|nr:LysR family transcriptional regulator [Zavarzinia compransoris]PWR18706.1 LysR family transcriptional regulator [Zavarzinia compransoris]TDP48685.1 LysR family transcriptional regulator [Zavarzinia compransoris]